MESALFAIHTFVLVHSSIFAMNATMDRMKEDALFAVQKASLTLTIVKNAQ